MPDRPPAGAQTRHGVQPSSEGSQETLERARTDLERTLDEIAASHAGRPQPDVLDALERAVAQAGVTPERADLSALAHRISQNLAHDH